MKKTRNKIQLSDALSDASSTKTEVPITEETDFLIVGIGASAGGLEAFEIFFRHVTPDCGMAFVLVPHLDPDHPSLLGEILQRITVLPVIEAQDQAVLSPNRVYVIPPNRDMAVSCGKLQLSAPEHPRGFRMPIDFFMRSLADDRGDKAIGIILSGTGTDGTLGLRAIHGAGGICVVQEPETARYDGMPRSVIDSGYATHILLVDAMPQTLLDIAHHRLALPAEPMIQSPAVLAGLSRILLMVRSSTGHDFSQYKKSTLGRRIERRMVQHRIDDIAAYEHYLKENPTELRILAKELLISVTNFFRDAEAFIVLKNEILPKLLVDKPDDYVFRVWVAGCATGEEAYSIAILLRELMDEGRSELRVQIFATDLAEDAITTAREGRYPPNIAQDVLPERLQRFFLKGDDGYFRVKKEIREMVVFAVQSVIKDPPFSWLDLLSCRNLLIYLEPELQSRLFLNFHCALKPGGVLFLSPSESVTDHPELFPPINRKWKLFRAASTGSARSMLSGNLLSWRTANDRRAPEAVVVSKPKALNVAELTNRLLLQCYAPASVLTDQNGNILYVHGETGRYLRPAPGQATLNVIEMAREGLQHMLRTAVLAAIAEGIPSQSSEVSVQTNGESSEYSMISVSLRALPVPNSVERMLLITFQDIAKSERPRRLSRAATQANHTHELRRNEELERELAYSRQNLQTTIAEQQATNEELMSTNEEMQSTNEELQATNEELETSREELQSLNEELITINAELQEKIQQLSGMHNDMKNLLDNINVATIFLDEKLQVRRFTRDALRIYRLLASDIGRPLNDIKPNLTNDKLIIEAQRVLDTLVPYEDELQTKDGGHYLARIQPYRTLDNVIDGVVMTFTDIGKRVVAEAALRLARRAAEGIVDAVHEPLIVLDGSLKIVLASRAFYESFAVPPEATLGHRIYDLGNRQWDIPSLRDLLENTLPRNQALDDCLVEHDFPGIGLRRVWLNARRIPGDSGEPQLILLAMKFADNGATKGSASGEKA